MALIKCPECGKEFSNLASECPQCACPIEYITGEKNEQAVKNENKIIDSDTSLTGLEKFGRIMSGGCPKCYSTNIQKNRITVAAQTKGVGEVRKKSFMARKANKEARKTMNMMTLGIWGLTTSPKSEYKEVNKAKTVYKTKTSCCCLDCGYTWEK